MNEILRLSCGFQVRGLADEKRSVDVIASTAAIDSYGEIVAQSWDLKRYLSNPIVLYGHNSWDMPIGFASNVRVEDGKLLATLNLVDEKASPMAERVWQGIKQGSLRAVSVGFRTRSKPTSVEVEGKQVLVLSDNELIEISVVPIPANPEALALEAKAFATLRGLAGKSNPQETPPMNVKALLQILDLEDSASDLDVTKSVESLRDNLASILAVTGKANASEALGVIQAWKSASEQVTEIRAKLTDLEKSAEESERATLIKRARDEGKLAPALLDWAKSCPLATLKAYAETAPAVPQFRTAPAEPTHSTGPLEWRGKKYGDLSCGEKHELHEENPELFRLMRDSDQIEH
jgi:HK97 family phage prohead protease